MIGQAVRFVAIPKRRHVTISCILENLIEHWDVILVHLRELDSGLGVLAKRGKLLPLASRSGIVVRHIGHGDIVPHVVFGEGEVATVALHAVVVVPASQEDAAAAGEFAEVWAEGWMGGAGTLGGDAGGEEEEQAEEARGPT